MESEITERFEKGIRKFNAGEFYDCHDILEDIWFEVRGSSRRFYQGIIHLAVGFYHLTHRRNLNGTLSQLGKGIDKLSNFSPEFQGVELKILLKKISDFIAELKKSENDFDSKKIPKIKFNRRKFESPV